MEKIIQLIEFFKFIVQANTPIVNVQLLLQRDRHHPHNVHLERLGYTPSKNNLNNLIFYVMIIDIKLLIVIKKLTNIVSN